MHGIPAFLTLPPLVPHGSREEVEVHRPVLERRTSSDPSLNSACTTENLNSALGAAPQRSPGSYPVWLLAHTGLFP